MAKGNNVGKNKRSSPTLLAGIAILVVVILLASSVFVYYEYYYKEEKTPSKVVEQKIVDDRISPLENQAVIIEVLRIRHRGLYDTLMKPGLSWRKAPSFYFNVEMDGVKYSSKDVEHLGTVVETLFNTWDTMFQENKVVRDAKEEQNTSSITLTIVERVKTGILGRKHQDIERDTISVVYDYKTGRWGGDDYFGDYDGYGHVLGKTFEIWFNVYQVDYDQDGIPYWTEVNILGTDPQRNDRFLDPDNDGIPTAWEWKWGYDPFTWDDHSKLDPDVDGLENIEEYQMEKYLANPYSQDIYIEIDYMEKNGILDPAHVFWMESQQAIIEKYAEHNIQMFFDMGWPDTPTNGGGEILPHEEQLSQDSGMILQYYEHHFPDERKGIFRYVLVGHAGPFNHPAKFNVYDTIHISYNLLPKTLLKHWLNPLWKTPPTPRAQRIKVAATLMHELGHSVGISYLTFEGCDNLTYLDSKAAKKEFEKTWGNNYQSVMNYYNIYDIKLLDYSNGKNGPPYDQNDWMELFVPTFEYNAEQVEEIYFEPTHENVIFNETPLGITGYEFDMNLTTQFKNTIKNYSPVAPIHVNWYVFKLKDKTKYPLYHEIKILVSPNVPYAGYANYADGNLDAKGNIHIYSLDEIIKEKTS